MRPSRDLHAALFGVNHHDPFTSCTATAHSPFTQTFTTFTRQGPSRSGGSLYKTPECVPLPDRTHLGDTNASS